MNIYHGLDWEVLSIFFENNYIYLFLSTELEQNLKASVIGRVEHMVNIQVYKTLSTYLKVNSCLVEELRYIHIR